MGIFSSSGGIVASTLIATGTTLRGELETEGNLHVDGTLDGEFVVDGDVSVGPEGVVSGSLKAKNLTVGGRVEGTIVVRGLLRVQSGGKVSDDVRYDALEVENGGVLEGRSGRIGEEAMSGGNQDATKESQVIDQA